MPGAAAAVGSGSGEELAGEGAGARPSAAVVRLQKEPADALLIVEPTMGTLAVVVALRRVAAVVEPTAPDCPLAVQVLDACLVARVA